MDGIEGSKEQARRANELYWESETSVNRIADQLGLSKGSLYAALQPLAAESDCPLCEEPLVYTNRTALEKGHLLCSGCGTEFEERSDLPEGAAVRAARAQSDGRAEPRRRHHPAPAPGTTDPEVVGDVAHAPATRTEPAPPSRAPDRPSGQLVLGTSMLALGLGLLMARVFRR